MRPHASCERAGETTVDFSFTEDQELLRKTVREFAEGEIAPHVMRYD